MYMSFQRVFFLLILGILVLTFLRPNGEGYHNSGVSSDTDKKLDVLPKRIVQIGPSAFIVTNALYLFPEASSRLIGVADGNQGNGFFASDMDPSFKDKTILPRQAGTETVLALKPDMAVMKDFMKSRMGEPLERMNIRTVYLNLETPETWMEDLDKLGELFGNKRRADELKSNIRRRVASVEEPLAKLEEKNKPGVLLLYWNIKDGMMALNVPPLSWIQTRMVEMAGGVPVWKDADLGGRWTLTGIEQIALWDPDVILVAAYHVSAVEAVEKIKNDDIWRQIRAVASNRIHAFPGDYYSWDQPDIRWLLGLKWLATILHPDYFREVNMVDEARAFYEEVYEMGEAEFNSLILPRLTGLN